MDGNETVFSVIAFPCGERMTVTLEKKKRKTLSLRILSPEKAMLSVPRGTTADAIRAFLNARTRWLEKKRNEMKMNGRAGQPPFQEEELLRIRKNAPRVLLPLLERRCAETGLYPARVSFRFQKSRWGSCSAKKTVSLNCLLALLEEELADYVIVHELCHLKYPDHSKRFWALVENYCLEYREKRKRLQETGMKYIDRLPE